MKTICNLIICFILSLSSIAQNDTIYLKKLLDKAYSFEQSEPQRALIIYDTIIAISEKNKNHIFSAKANNYKGIVFSDLGKYDSAVFYYEKSILEFEKIKEEKGIAANYINIGNTFQLKGDFSNAISYYLKGISIYEKIKDNYRLSISYGNLATIFEDINQLENAKDKYFESIKFAKKINDSVQLVYNYYNLSNLYGNTNKNDSLLISINNAKRYLNNSSGYHLKYLVNYGEAKYYFNIKDTKIAYIKINNALGYLERTNNPYYLSLTKYFLANIFIKENKIDKALIVALKAEAIAKEHNQFATLIKVCNQLSIIYDKKNNLKKAFYYKELEYKFKDSILSENQYKTINTLNIKYETEKKEKEIIVQQLQLKENENELQKKASQFNYMFGIIAFLIVASILTWFLYQQREKRKNQELLTLKRDYQIKTLESLIEGEEKERFRIAKELHDGVNGDLSAIKYKLSSLLEMNNTVIKEAIVMIDDSCKQVRAISHNLVPPSLENFNLIEATSDYCSNLNDVTFNVSILFQHIGETINISKKAEINAFRIIQELVTNSIKHAMATTINVQISCRNNSVQITVEDDGFGFNKNEIISGGIGLGNVQSRLDYLNATLDFVSNDKGTSYTIDIDKEQLNDN